MASKLLTLFSRDPLQRAEAFLREGKKDKAAEEYAKAGEHAQAIKLALEAGDEAKAVEYSLLAAFGNVPEGYADASAGQAAELLVVRGFHQEAIALFELGKEYRRAAESAIKLKQVPRAARSYERAKAWAEAALYYEKAGQMNDALRVLELESRRLKGDPRAGGELADRIRQVDVRRAEILARLGRSAEGATLLRDKAATPKTAQLLEAGGQILEALLAYLQLGELAQAARLLPRVSMADRPRVAQAYRAAGHPEEAANLYSVLGHSREAAEAYEAAGDWPRAAGRWEDAKDALRAGQAWARAGRPRDAARSFLAGGKPQLAATAYAQAGDHAAAAAAYLKAGQLLDAGAAFLAAGDKAQAARTLMRIGTGTIEHREGTLLLAPLLIEEGLGDETLRRLATLPDDPRAAGGAQALDQLYWQGRAHEVAGRLDKAQGLYAKLVAQKPEHRDVAVRLAEIETRRDQGGAEATVYLGGSRPPGPGDPEPARRELPRSEVIAVGSLLAGRYDIQAELGRGGMGRVYKAHDRELGEAVAIKTLLRSDADHAGDEERLLREVQICRKITHPNVVRVFDLGRFADGIFITMELLLGTSLEKLIEESGPLPLPRAKTALVEICAGLDEAHGLGVVHRDLKPSNVIVTATRLKILDFGIARMLGSETRLTQTGFAVGSPMYMSPEQLQGFPLDCRSDLYSLGIVAFTMLAGKEPFQAQSAAAVALMHLQQPPPDLRKLRPDLPPGWAELVAKLLAKEPAGRYQTAREVAAATSNL
jgi:tetratricopeptide (TPR) repeat protein